MGWWQEIKSAGAFKFGGPTGIYNIVVLMSWWCSLLKNQPTTEYSDCIRTLDDIDRAILSVIHITDGPSDPVPTSGGSSQKTSTVTPAEQPRGPRRVMSEDPVATVAPVQPRGSKRVLSEEPSSRKRSRRAKV